MAQQEQRNTNDPEKQVLDTYKSNVHGLEVEIKIEKYKDFTPDYLVSYIGISEASKLLLNSLRTEITHMVPINPAKIQDEEYTNIITTKYIEASSILLV
ncbi:hypothetical protein M1141_01960, partial [Candidatus Marsarchaeota archaeon]|nr:hypothetical protein [Candidatus Marsarchaeota archaeon]